MVDKYVNRPYLGGSRSVRAAQARALHACVSRLRTRASKIVADSRYPRLANSTREQRIRHAIESGNESALWTICEREEIDDCEFMKRTSNMSRGHNDFTRGIWHIRPDFIPRYRFFGAFFRADWFVVFTKKERNAINTNQRWLKEIDVACRSWDALLPHNKPHSGNELSEYVTFNAEHCDDRW